VEFDPGSLRHLSVTIPSNRAGLQPSPAQPTDPHLIWGTRQDRLDRRFVSRSIVVEHLISSWTVRHSTGVDVSGGAGRWLSTLAPHFRQFTHLDLSPNALDVAKADHPEYSNTEFGIVDLLCPKEQQAHLSGRMWDAAFCFDTLLYRGDFVEAVLLNMRAFIRPGGIAIIDVPVRFRYSIARWVKRQRYRGPERAFSPRSVLTLACDAGYICRATAYQYRELSPATHYSLVTRGLTGWVPWPSTWMYLVLGVPDRR
jgi:SAM-dependent methyltransferase